MLRSYNFHFRASHLFPFFDIICVFLFPFILIISALTESEYIITITTTITTITSTISSQLLLFDTTAAHKMRIIMSYLNC